MRYGFTKDGGFVVADDDRRIGEFAFATSEYAERAKKDPERTAKTMLDNTWTEAPAHLKEQRYLLCCEALKGD